MDPFRKSVADEGSKTSADDAGNIEPLPHTVLLCKKEVEVGEGSSTRVEQVINEVTTEAHEKDPGEWIQIGDNNEGGAEEAEVEAEVAAEVATRRIFGIDLNTPPQEEDIDLNRSPPQEED